MAYGEIKVDTVTFTDGGIDKSVSISGLVQNPTFSGNITVTGTISGNTVQGQTVSGATITGGAAAFTTVTGGVATITSGVFALGSASNPSISFNGDANSGLYSPGADQVAVATNGTGRLFVDASGNVGVGTSSVNALLEVNNSTAGGEVQRIEGNYSGSGSVILTNWRRAGGSVAAAFKYNDDSSPLCMSIGTTTSHEFRIRTADTDAITIDASQQVGIGTTSPQAKLEIAQSSDNTDGPKLRIANNGNTLSNGQLIGGIDFFDGDDSGEGVGAYIYSYTTDSIGRASGQDLRFGAGESERLRITSAGLVGIGSSSPGALLDINGSGNIVRLGDGTNTIDVRFKGPNNWATQLDTSADKFNIQRNSTPLVTVDSAGRLGIGTTSPGESLSVNGNASIGATSSSGYRLFVNGSAYVAGSTNYIDGSTIFRTEGASEIARLDSSGRLLVGTSSTSVPATAVFQANSGTSTGGALLYLQRGQAASSAIAAGNNIGYITFTDNADNAFAEIGCQTDATTGSNDYPGRLVFSTTSDGASSPTERLRITSAGLVGIGTSSPGATLDIIPTGTNIPLRITSNDSGVVYKSSSAFNKRFQFFFQDNSGTQTAKIGADLSGANASNLQFVAGSGATPQVTLNSSGQVGIGTTSPGSLLSLKPASGGGLEIQDTGGTARAFATLTGSPDFSAKIKTSNYYLDLESAQASGGQGHIRFFTGVTTATQKAAIDSSGRLLVGTSSARGQLGITPGVQSEGTNFAQGTLALTVNSNSGAYPLISLARSGGTSLGSNTIVSNGDIVGKIFFTAADGVDMASAVATIEAVIDGTPGSDDLPGRLVFSTTADGAASPTERMRINNAGYTLLFGDNVLNLASSASAGTSAVLIDASYSATAVGTGTRSFIVYNNGNVLNTNNSYGSLSDVKLKENIIDAASQWSDIKALQVRNYNFKEGQTHTQIGLVAQEVELVSPGLVSESPDRDEDGNDLGTVTKSVNYSVLYMKAVKALQEAIAKIETLEGMVAVNNITIDEQEHQISALAARLDCS
jgi:hypothetical protein